MPLPGFLRRSTAGSTRRPSRARGRNQRLPWIIAASVVGFVVLLAGGFGLARLILGPAAAPTPVPSALPPEPSPSPRSTPTGVATWALNGQPQTVLAERPAIAVKIENSVDARPHIGLELADLVYEELVEGGVTRFIAVYHSNMPDVVLPVRSIRPMDGPIVAPLRSAIAFSGGQLRFAQRAEDLGLQLIAMDYGDDGFRRVNDRWSPHDVAGSLPEFLAQIDAAHSVPPNPIFTYARVGQASSMELLGTPARALHITMSSYSQPNWTWDPSSGTWLRYEDDEPFVNAEGRQFGAANVVCIGVEIRSAGGADAAGSYIPETIVVGSGDGFIASGGHVLAIKWSKASETEQMIFTDQAGKPIRLTPGNTWFELVPNDESYSYE